MSYHPRNLDTLTGDLPSPLDVRVDDTSTPTSVTFKGKTVAIASIDDRWEEVLPEEPWRDAPMTLKRYLVTLVDDRKLLVSRNMTYERWYYIEASQQQIDSWLDSETGP